MELKVCVTGFTGFLGVNVKEFFTKSKTTFVEWDRNKVENLKDSNIILYLAGRAHQMKDSSSDPLREFRKVNRNLALSLAKIALEKKVKKFIYISSIKVIGEKSGSYTEKNQTNPDDPYGISKLEAEQGLKDLFENQSDSQCIIIRPPMIYGPENKGNMIPLLKAASKRISLPLQNTKGKRSMIYVGNLCDALLKIILDQTPDRPQVQTYFLSDGEDITSGELYSQIFKAMHQKTGVFPVPEFLFRLGGKAGTLVEKLTGKKLPLNQSVVSRLFDEYRFSNQKFCDDYRWSPPYTVKEGIQKTVEWYRSTVNSEQ